MVRIIQYLKILPVKTVSIDKVEADDIIAYLSKTVLKHPEDKAFIVSSDKDFLQLVTDNVIVYSPIEKEYYTRQSVIDKYKISPYNFILHKTLLGDNSDKIKGVKGLGQKGLLKKFPELIEKDINWDDILNICKNKISDHIVYARIIHGQDDLEKNYKIMDLSNPMLSSKDKEWLNEIVESNDLQYYPDQFVSMYNEDQIGGLIRNVEFWIKDCFQNLVIKK